MKHDAPVALMIILAILGSVGVVGIVLHLVPNDVFPARDAVALLQGLATVAAVALGALFAYRNSLLFRSFEPHLTVTQAAASRPVGTQYVHISVITTLRNTSKVRVEIREGLFRIQQIQPMSDEDVVHLYNQSFKPGAFASIDWPVLDTATWQREPDALVVEPGESHQEPREFIVSKDVETVLVYSYFYNRLHKDGSQSAQGWTATTFYDIVLQDSGKGD